MQFLDFSLIRMISERIVRKVFLALDARWEARWKDLNDYARETDTLDVLEDFPYQRVAFDDGVVRDYNFAAQFRPKFIPAAETEVDETKYGWGKEKVLIPGDKGLRRGKYEIIEKLGAIQFFHFQS